MRGDARSPAPVSALALRAANPQVAVPLVVALIFAAGSPLAFAQAPTASRPIDKPQPLAEREAVPGRLRVRVFHSDARPGAPGPTWTYATDGFRTVAQKEMILVVLRRPAEAVSAFPEDPIQFFASALPTGGAGAARVGRGLHVLRRLELPRPRGHPGHDLHAARSVPFAACFNPTPSCSSPSPPPSSTRCSASAPCACSACWASRRAPFPGPGSSTAAARASSPRRRPGARSSRSRGWSGCPECARRPSSRPRCRRSWARATSW